MLSFSLTGSIGCILATAPGEVTLAISAVLDREGEPLRVVWVVCVARERALRAKILVEGEIEQRRRQVGELAFHSAGFVILSIERLPSLTAGAAS